jgi:hypothetical protein
MTTLQAFAGLGPISLPLENMACTLQHISPAMIHPPWVFYPWLTTKMIYSSVNNSPSCRYGSDTSLIGSAVSSTFFHRGGSALFCAHFVRSLLLAEVAAILLLTIAVQGPPR